MAPRYEICAGLEKGHKTTKNTLKAKPSNAKGKLTKSCSLARAEGKVPEWSHPVAVQSHCHSPGGDPTHLGPELRRQHHQDPHRPQGQARAGGREECQLGYQR